MLGLIITLVLAALVVLTSVSAMRRGELALGERTLRRNQVVFWVVTAGGALAGVAVMTVSIRAYQDVRADHDGPPRELERDGVRVVFPAHWEALPQLEALMGAAANHVLAVGGDGAELLVLWPPTRPADEGAEPLDLHRVAADLRNPAFDYTDWEVREADGGLVVDAAYQSPRGQVIARHILFVPQDGALHTVIGTCSTEGDVAPCRRAIASMRRRAEPAAPAPVVPPAHLACSDHRACVADSQGKISCWGQDRVSRTVASVAGIDRLRGAGTRICALAGGAVVCLADDDDEPKPVPELAGVSQIAVAPTGVCGITPDQTVRCTSEVAAPPPDLVDVHALAMGAAHGCALTKQAEIVCWGDNEGKQLGTDDAVSSHRFVIRGAQTIVAAGRFNCVLLATGQPWCWGSGWGGDTTAQPTRVDGANHVATLAATSSGACGSPRSGSMVCWGETTWVAGHEAATKDLGDVSALAVGETQACAVSASRGVSCWKPGDARQAQIVAP